MGNGNGLISYGKSRDLTPEGSMTKAIIECKKNIIAIPLDETCTFPRPITSRFQDNLVYLRPNPGFNSWGHPVFSMMLALTGIKHVGFKLVHTGRNNYTMLHSLFKAVTQNTTPQ
jgi:ribosomal protein S5